MKICFFNSNQAWGGGEKWHLDSALALKLNGFDVTLFAAPQSELFKRAKDAGLTIQPMRVSNFSFLNPFKVCRLKKQFKNINPDAVIINLSSDLKFAGIAARKAEISKRIYRRGSAIPIKNNLLNRWIFKRIVTGIITNSEETRSTILRNNPLLFRSDKIKVIYNGLDLNDFKDIQLKKAGNSYDQPIIIGTIGRLVYQKGQHFLLEAAEILKKRNLKFRVIIGGDGPLMKELNMISEKLNVTDLVEFRGFISDVKLFMESLDVFALPSRWEGFGYVLAEAMACQRPIVAFNISSNPELIRDGETGYLVKPFDIENFALALERLIENRELRLSMGKNGRTMVEEKFSIDLSIQQLIEYLRV